MAKLAGIIAHQPLCHVPTSDPHYALFKRYTDALGAQLSANGGGGGGGGGVLENMSKRSPSADDVECAGAELTPRGILQHISLGKFLDSAYERHLPRQELQQQLDQLPKHPRDREAKQLQKRQQLKPLLQNKRRRNETSMYVRTTRYSRTVQSALALLYGFSDGFRRTSMRNFRLEVGNSDVYLCSEKHSGKNIRFILVFL